MADRTRQARTVMDSRRASSILFPIAKFLQAGGMSDEVALEVFASTLKKASQPRSGRKLEHIGHPTRYTDIVSTWTRNQRFIDSNGQPRELSMEGKDGFKALVRSVAWKADPSTVLQVLMRYGNVRRTKNRKYQLLRPFFYTSNHESMAYEPVLNFFSDVTSMLGTVLKRSEPWKGPELFWTKSENARISEAMAKRFATFAQERGTQFLEELDDWLKAHSDRKKVSQRLRRRVGLGIFSVYSDPESLDVRR